MSIYYMLFFVTAFFVQQQILDLSAAFQDQHNIGSVVLAAAVGAFGLISICYVIFNATDTKFGPYFGEPAVLCMTILYLLQIASASYASSKLGSLYHSLPALATLMAGLCLFIFLRSVGNLAMAELSRMWHVLNVLQVSVLGLLLVCAATDPGGALIYENTTAPRLYGSWFSIHPNQSSFMAMISLVHFITRPRTTLLDRLPILICVAVLILAQGRTEFAGMLMLGALSFLFFPRTRGPLAIAGILLVILAGLEADKIATYLLRGETASTLSSMNGRTRIWTIALIFGRDHLWLGRGVWSAIRLDMARLYAGSVYGGISVADNTYLNTFLETGLVGVFFVTATLVRLVWGTASQLKYGDRHDALEFFFVAVAILVKSVPGDVITAFTPFQAYAIFIAMYLIFSNRTRRLNMPAAAHG